MDPRAAEDRYSRHSGQVEPQTMGEENPPFLIPISVGKATLGLLGFNINIRFYLQGLDAVRLVEPLSARRPERVGICERVSSVSNALSGGTSIAAILLKGTIRTGVMVLFLESAMSLYQHVSERNLTADQ